MDVKIFIKTEFGGLFDKGNGIELLINHLKCDLTDGTILVCGDSITDIPMLEYCLTKNPKVKLLNRYNQNFNQYFRMFTLFGL